MMEWIRVAITQSLKVWMEGFEMPNNYGAPYGCKKKNGVWVYRSHWEHKDQELKTFIWLIWMILVWYEMRYNK